MLIKIFRRVRKIYFTYRVKRKVKKVGNGLKVNAKSNVNCNTFLGNNVNFNGMNIQGKGQVVIGDNFHSGIECLMITDVHNYNNGNAIPYDETYIVKNIKIDDNVWLGSKTIILGGVTIGEGAIIQAGSVIVNDIPKYAIAGGHPAKVFKYRNIELYEKLKREGRFH